MSVTEAELYAGVTCAQDMLYVMNVIISLGCKVKLPKQLQIDNRGTVDLANSWSIGGRTRHIDVRQVFLRELKEQGIINVTWRSATQKHVSLSVTEAELYAGVTCAQDMLYVMNVIISLNCKVKLPIPLQLLSANLQLHW